VGAVRHFLGFAEGTVTHAWSGSALAQFICRQVAAQEWSAAGCGCRPGVLGQARWRRGVNARVMSQGPQPCWLRGSAWSQAAEVSAAQTGTTMPSSSGV
jgi:hypothetical protein